MRLREQCRRLIYVIRMKPGLNQGGRLKGTVFPDLLIEGDYSVSSHCNSFKAYFLDLEESLYDEMKQFVTMVQAKKNKKFIKHPIGALLKIIFSKYLCGVLNFFNYTSCQLGTILF